MDKVANKECSVCHFRKPANEMRQIKKKVKTGSSTGVYNIGGKKGLRGSFREHYRIQNQWVCDECHVSFGGLSSFWKILLAPIWLPYYIAWKVCRFCIQIPITVLKSPVTHNLIKSGFSGTVRLFDRARNKKD